LVFRWSKSSTCTCDRNRKNHIKSSKKKNHQNGVFETLLQTFKQTLLVPSVRSFSVIVCITTTVAVARMTTPMLPSHWESYAGDRTVWPFRLHMFQHFCQIFDVGRRVRSGSLSKFSQSLIILNYTYVSGSRGEWNNVIIYFNICYFGVIGLKSSRFKGNIKAWTLEGCNVLHFL